MKIKIFFIFALGFFKAEAQTSALNMADSLYAIGNYTDAVNTYAKVGTKQSDLQIARAYHHIGSYDKAAIQYEAIIQKDTSQQIAKFELGKLYIKVKEIAKAFDVFSQLTKQYSNPEYFYYQGIVLQDLGKIDRSIEAFKHGVAIDSTHLRSIFELGKYYLSIREYNSALKFINRGLLIYPKDVGLINLKALAFYNNDQYKEAKPLFEALLEMGEKKDFIYEKLAYCYYKLWEFELSKRAYNKLLDFDNAISKAYYGLGEVYWRERKLDSAAIFFNKAIEAKNPILSKEYNALAQLAREENDLKKAMEYYKKAFEEDKENYMNYYQICTLADQYYKDPKIKLDYYQGFINQFGKNKPYFSEIVTKRISELKEEIHYVSD